MTIYVWRIAKTIARATTRLLLATGVAVSSAFAVLYTAEALIIKRGVAGEQGFWTALDHMWIPIAAAIITGLAAALAADRVWRRLRSRGPSLARPR